MILTMCLDIDHANNSEYVHNTTSCAFSVVASVLGISSLLPFLKAVCQRKKSWQAHHTIIHIVQQIAIMCSPATLWCRSFSHHYLCANVLVLAEKTLNLFPTIEMFLLTVGRDCIEG